MKVAYEYIFRSLVVSFHLYLHPEWLLALSRSQIPFVMQISPRVLHSIILVHISRMIVGAAALGLCMSIVQICLFQKGYINRNYYVQLLNPCSG